MRDPQALAAYLVDQMRAIPDFAAAMDGPGNIFLYQDDDGMGVTHAADEAKYPSFMLAYDRTDSSGESSFTREHSFKGYLRPKLGFGYGAALTKLVNGKPGGPTGPSFEHLQFPSMPELMMGPVSGGRSSDGETTELFEVNFSVKESGIGPEEE